MFGLAAQHPERFGQFLGNVGREWTDRVTKILRAEGVPAAEARPIARHLVTVWRGLQFELIASGHRANIDRSYFGKLERGERQPSLAVILRIAQGLTISASALLSKVERLLLPETA